jgi:hypothetical protein
LPVKREVEKAQALVVHGATKEVREDLGLLASGVHSGKAWNGHRVEPGPDVGREELVDEHAKEAIPEPSQRLGVLDLLPVQTLKRLDGGKGAPVDGIDVPDGKGAHQAGNAVTEQTDRQNAQDHGDSADGDSVEEVLSSKHHDAGGRVGGRGGGNGADGVLLKVPMAGVDELGDPDLERKLSSAAGFSPFRFHPVATGKHSGPGLAHEVGNEHNEGTADGNLRGFELNDVSLTGRAQP